MLPSFFKAKSDPDRYYSIAFCLKKLLVLCNTGHNKRMTAVAWSDKAQPIIIRKDIDQLDILSIHVMPFNEYVLL